MILWVEKDLSFPSVLAMLHAEHAIHNLCGVCRLLSVMSDKDPRSSHNAIAHCGSVMAFLTEDIGCTPGNIQCGPTKI